MRAARVFPVLLTLLMLALCPEPSGAGARAGGLLVAVDAVKATLGDPAVRLVDMTTEPADYRRGHIPGAVYLHVNDARIAVPEGGFRLPTADEGARLLGALGITPETTVVIYDDMGGLHASRLFFTLEVLGHTRVSLLDGGIQAWKRAGYPVSGEVFTPARTTYRPTIRPDLVASAEWLREHLHDPALALVDSRSPAEYTGRDVRAKRGGHIPGAVNVEWKEHLQADMRFKPADRLREMYVTRGVTPAKTVVTYCQTHHRAAHAYFVLRLLGYPRVAGYDRSWVEWGNRADLPVAR